MASDPASSLAAPCRAYSYAAFAFLVHNIEELTGLASWIATLELSIAIPAVQMSRAIIGLTLAGMAVLVVGRSVPHRAVQIVVALVVGMLLANVVSHVTLSFVTLSYMPGTATALALVLPAGLWLYRNLPLTDPARLTAGGVGVIAMAPVTWAALWLAG